ncbi:MAG: hypothetical protein K0U78_15045 [Actinomycetia bacterium]|nr:hypothetical protein [Actinomycetes bacterium]
MVNDDKTKDELLNIISNWDNENKTKHYDSMRKIIWDSNKTSISVGEQWLVRIIGEESTRTLGDASIQTHGSKELRMETISQVRELSVCFRSDEPFSVDCWYKISDVEFVEKLNG